jgi:hypothetical protein
MGCIWGGSNMHLGVREQSRVPTLPLGMHAAYKSSFHLSLCPTPPHLSLKMRDNLDRAMDTGCRPAPSVFALVACHALALAAGFVVYNLHTANHAAKFSHVPHQGSSHYFMTRHDSLRITRFREPTLCEFGRGVRIRLGPPGMAKA